MHLTRSLLVVAGTPNRLKNVDDTVIRRTKNIFVPQNFLKRNTNNIALLQLYESWPTNNPSIDIINLPSKQPNKDTLFIVLGWGRFYKVRKGEILYIYLHIISYIHRVDLWLVIWCTSRSRCWNVRNANRLSRDCNRKCFVLAT